MRPNLSTNPAQRLGLTAGIFGLTGVLLGAFGAHALKTQLEAAGMLAAWQTAVEYQLFHAVGLLALTGWVANLSSQSTEGASGRARVLIWTARCWTVGIMAFSGSLYALALGGPKWLGPITPLGGLALMVGWVLVMAASCKTQK